MRERKPRAVVDTNLLISGLLSPYGSPNRLLNALRNKLFVLVISFELLEELEEVLTRPKLAKYHISKEEVNLLVHSLSQQIQKTSSSIQIPIQIRDPKDEKVLICAIEGKADYLITGDNDLLTIKNNHKISPLNIVTVDEFLMLLKAENKF